jgi:hypothetical protein
VRGRRHDGTLWAAGGTAAPARYPTGEVLATAGVFSDLQPAPKREPSVVSRTRAGPDAVVTAAHAAGAPAEPAGPTARELGLTTGSVLGAVLILLVA